MDLKGLKDDIDDLKRRLTYNEVEIADCMEQRKTLRPIAHDPNRSQHERATAEATRLHLARSITLISADNMDLRYKLRQKEAELEDATYRATILKG